MLTKNAIGNMINRYNAVLSKCQLLNVFGTLALVGALVLGAGPCGIAGIDGLFEANAYAATTGEYNACTVVDYAGGGVYYTDYYTTYTITNGALTLGGRKGVVLTPKGKTTGVTTVGAFIVGYKTDGGYTFTETESETDFIKVGENTYYVTAPDTASTTTTTIIGESRTDSSSSDSSSDFIANTKDGGYGGAINNTATNVTISGDFIGNLVTSVNNGETKGGAIFNGSDASIDSIVGNFVTNKVEATGFSQLYAYGGAIGNEGTISSISGNFIGNESTSIGGAIYNSGTIGDSADSSTGITADFIGNVSTLQGGAIYNSGIITSISSDFVKNTAHGAGGAIFNDNGSIGTITGDFANNSGAGAGGAIQNRNGSIITTIFGNFSGNTTGNVGGAICNYVEKSLDSANSVDDSLSSIIGDSSNLATGIIANFISNTAEKGGAVYNAEKCTITSISGDFIGNNAKGTATSQGGAIYNSGTITSISSDFTGNKAIGTFGKGGAIYNFDGGTISALSANFTGNKATYYGGAIYAAGSVTFLSAGSGYSFTNNVAGSGNTADYNAIYVDNKNITLTFKLGDTNNADGSFTLNDGISGWGSYTVAITGEGTGSHTFNLNDEIATDGKITIADSTLNLGTFKHTGATDIDEKELGESTTFGSLGESQVVATNSILNVQVGKNSASENYVATAGALSVDADSQLNITSGTLALSGDSTIFGALNMSSGTVLDVVSRGTDIRGAQLAIQDKAIISVADGARLTAGIDNFVLGAQSTAAASPLSMRTDGLVDNVTLNGENAKLVLDGAEKFVNKQDFVTFLKGDTGWKNFTNDATCTVTYNGDGTLDDVFAFNSATSAISLTNLNLTGYYSLNNFLAEKNNDGVYILNEAVFGGELADGTKLSATNLFVGERGNAASTIGTGAELTLAGGDDVVLLDKGTLTNNGTLSLGTGSFNGDLSGVGTTNINGTVTIDGGTVNLLASDVNNDGGNGSITITSGTLNVAYDDLVDSDTSTYTEALRQKITLNGTEETVNLIIGDVNATPTVVNSTQYQALIGDVAATVNGAVRVESDSHLLGLEHLQGKGTITLEGYTIGENYLSNFLTEAENRGPDGAFTVNGAITYDATGSQNTLLAGTKLTVTILVAGNGRTFSIAENAKLTLVGAEGNPVVLDAGELVNNGELKLGNGAVEGLEFNGVLTSNVGSSTAIINSTTFSQNATIHGNLSIASGKTLTFGGNAIIGNALTVNASTTTFNGGGSVAGPMTINGDSTLNVNAGTLNVNGGSDINGSLNIGSNATLHVASGTTNIVDASMMVGGTLSVSNTGMLEASFDDFVSGGASSATKPTPLSMTGLEDHVALVAGAKLEILGQNKYVNKEDFAKFLNTNADWQIFTKDQAYSVNFGESGSLDDKYSFDTGAGIITITGLNLTDYYSLSHFIVGTDNTLAEPVIGGNLAENVTLKATNLLHGDNSTSTIASGADLTLTGGEGVVLLDNGTLENSGSLTLGAGSFKGNLSGTGATTINGAVAITGGTFDLSTANAVIVSGGDTGASITINSGKVIAKYDDVMGTDASLQGDITLNGESADAAVLELQGTKSFTSTEYNAELGNIATEFASCNFTRGDVHVKTLASENGSILTNFTLKDNYLADFIADSGDATNGYIYAGDMDNNATDPSKNILDTKLTANSLNAGGNTSAIFEIVSGAELTLKGSEFLLDAGTLKNEGTLTLGDGEFNGSLNGTGTTNFNGSMSIIGGTFDLSTANAVTANGPDASIVVDGGELKAKYDDVIKNDAPNSGALDGKVVLASGTLTLNGSGELNSKDYTAKLDSVATAFKDDGITHNAHMTDFDDNGDGGTVNVTGYTLGENYLASFLTKARMGEEGEYIYAVETIDYDSSANSDQNTLLAGTRLIVNSLNSAGKSGASFEIAENAYLVLGGETLVTADTVTNKGMLGLLNGAFNAVLNATDTATTAIQDTVSLNKGATISGTVDIHANSTLEFALGTSNLVGATFTDLVDTATISIADGATVTAGFDDFVTNAGAPADANAAYGDTTLSMSGLEDHFSLVDGASLILDGEAVYVNKEDFAEFLKGTGTGSWDEFVASAPCVIDYGASQNPDNGSATLDNSYTFNTGNGTVTVTNVNLTTYYSLDRFLVTPNTDGSYTIPEAVISGTLVSGVTLSASTLLKGVDDTIIEDGATLTLTGAGYMENGTETNKGVLANVGANVTNNGTLDLAAGSFGGDLTTGATGTTTFQKNATVSGVTTVAENGVLSIGIDSADEAPTVNLAGLNLTENGILDINTGKVVLTGDSTLDGTLFMNQGTGIEVNGAHVAVHEGPNTQEAYLFAKGSKSAITVESLGGGTANFNAYADEGGKLIFGALPTEGESKVQYDYITRQMGGAFDAKDMLYIGLDKTLTMVSGASLVVDGAPIDVTNTPAAVPTSMLKSAPTNLAMAKSGSKTNATPHTTAGGANFGANSLFIADMAGFGTDQAVIDGGGNALVVDANSVLALVNAGEEEYIILDNFGTVTNVDTNNEGNIVPWNEESVMVGNCLLVADSVTGSGTDEDPYKVKVRQNIDEALFDTDGGGALEDVMNSGEYGPNTTNSLAQYLYQAGEKGDVALDKAKTNTATAGANAGIGAAGMAATRAAAATTTMRNTIVYVGDVDTLAAAGGTLLIKDANGNVKAEYDNVVQVADNGSMSDAPAGLGNTGNGLGNSIGLWAMPFYGHESISGAQVGSYTNDTRTDMYGMTMGIDKTFTPSGIDVCRFGLAFNVGTGETEGSGYTGSSESNFDFFGLAAYGSMRNGAATMSASISYTNTDGEFNSEGIQGKTDTDVWYGVLNSEYAFTMGTLENSEFFSNFNIVPYTGIGFMTSKVDDYTTSLGSAVETDRQNVFTIPVGLKFNKEFTLDSGWIVKPEIAAGMIFAEGDLYQRTVTGNSLGSNLDTIQSQVMDRATMDLGFSFDMRRDNFGIFFDYSLEKSDMRTAHGVSAKVEYRF